MKILELELETTNGLIHKFDMSVTEIVETNDAVTFRYKEGHSDIEEVFLLESIVRIKRKGIINATPINK